MVMLKVNLLLPLFTVVMLNDIEQKLQDLGVTLKEMVLKLRGSVVMQKEILQ